MFVLGMDSTVDTTTLPYLPKVFSGGCSKVVARLSSHSLARGLFGGKALVDRRFQAATKEWRDRTLLPGILVDAETFKKSASSTGELACKDTRKTEVRNSVPTGSSASQTAITMPNSPKVT